MDNISKYCSKPFREFEIDVDGECYCCCRWWNYSYSFGNILEQSAEEIWNGDRAKELRRSILEGDYKYCNIKECIMEHSPDVKYEIITDMPQEVSLCYDYSCTARCVFCNDSVKMLSEEECNKWNSIIDSKLIPLLSNARFVRLSMVGEIFVSRHSQKLVAEIAAKYPNVRFEIVSNGIYATEENIKKLGIEDRIEAIKFSIPSFKPDTYKKMVRNGNIDSVNKNLEYIADLKKQNKIRAFQLNFIISSVNYKELPEYAKRAKQLGAIVDCLLLNKKDESTEFLRDFERYNVANPKHPKYNDFIDTINSKDFLSLDNVNINKNIQKLKKVSLFQQAVNTYNFYCKKH